MRTESVGMVCAISILLKGLSYELAFVDVDEGKWRGETVDLQHGSPFIKMPNIISSKDDLVTADSNLMIITAGICPGKVTYYDVVQQNVFIFKLIISSITQYYLSCKMIDSNPMDILN